MNHYKEYNPHPQGKNVGDCVKRALTKASGMTYQELSNELNRIKRSLGARSYASNSVWKKFMSDRNWKTEVTYPAKKGSPRMSGLTFCETHPEGTYILHMAKHLTCCVDGVIYDSWDCLDKCVYSSWEVVPAENAVDLERASKAAPALTTKNPETVIFGNAVVQELAAVVGSKVKTTKDGQIWISLTHEQHAIVIDRLINDERYREYRWNTKVGSKKTTILDEKTGATFILKSGKSSYFWCTDSGK